MAMCDDCRRREVWCQSSVVVVEVSLWGTPLIWLDTEPERPVPDSVLLGPRDALKVAWHLLVAAVRLWRLQRRERREFPEPHRVEMP